MRFFVALNEIPSASLVPELTDDYDERTSILSYRFFFGWWGGLAMTVLAYGVFLQPDADHPTGVLNPQGYGRYGLVASVVLFAAILISALGTHWAIPYLRQPPVKRGQGVWGAFARAARDAVEPLVPGAVLRRHLRRHGGRAGRARSASTSTPTSGS